MPKKIYEDIPAQIFSPEGRKLEYWLTKKAIREIRLKKIPEKKKANEIKSCWGYFFEYEHQYNKYLEQKFFEEIEKNLRETDILEKDYEADKSWKRFLIKENSRLLEALN